MYVHRVGDAIQPSHPPSSPSPVSPVQCHEPLSIVHQALCLPDLDRQMLMLNIQNTKIMASGPITSWQIDGETV